MIRKGRIAATAHNARPFQSDRLGTSRTVDFQSSKPVGPPGPTKSVLTVGAVNANSTFFGNGFVAKPKPGT